MSIKSLNHKDQGIIKNCLNAVVNGPFFDDIEFHALFGLTRNEIKEILLQYPNIDEDDDNASGNDDSWLAINNSFVNLIGYPHGQDKELAIWIGVNKNELENLYQRWRKS